MLALLHKLAQGWSQAIGGYQCRLGGNVVVSVAVYCILLLFHRRGVDSLCAFVFLFLQRGT